MPLRYQNKVVIVTGGSKGIGRGIVKAFVENGAKVVFCARGAAAGEALETEFNTLGPGACKFVECDVTKEDQIQRLIAVTVELHGHVDCLVNNAGWHPPHKPTDETTAEEFRNLLNLNLVSYFLASKFALPYLRQRHGNIINISSLVGTIGQKDAAPYVATKGAIISMTKAMAVDESKHKVRVNCISPGNVMTPLWEELAAQTADAAATVHAGEKTQALHARLLQTLPFSFGALRFASSFKAADLTIERNPECKPKPDPSALMFGKHFSDHMLTISWSEKDGWDAPQIKPFQNLSLHPASSALHYSIELFEGMKAFRGVDNHIRLFRPMLNMERMHRSTERSCLPLFDKTELLQCIKKLVEVDQDWVPFSQDASLYIRPTFIGTEPSLGVSRAGKALIFVIIGPVGPYFATGSFNPVSLLADPAFVRAWKGGVGEYKMGGNYGPTIAVQTEALKQGCQQVLWLYGPDEEITEVGTMNLFIYWTNTKGERELVTPPLDGIILPGVTRQSLLDLGRTWGDFKVTERKMGMKELLQALDAGRVLEVFGAGTACVVCPVGSLLYRGKTYQIPTMQNGPDLAKRFYKELTDIQYGRKPSEWAPVVV
ncbi:PREDICTED: branched-chain-amino-acid aminotransferase, cytosolic-like isoform X1 [Poecilia mexicana]|uniref:Branched-chain-amino-acid aminotransferase, mitochondrial n=1 Tax=Poecilia mexicana TaxID=48701 RepID=A0A3B3YBX5_9TELE|nr:PREDICTED: branched-chain-amino-acid aminotransferase, cytosolic-like isoform X1 [Poecilia mexicana]